MINLLVEDLSVYLQKKLKEFSLETKKGRRSVKIFKYFLPTKRKETEDDFPLIIIRPFEGEDSKQSDATVKFICGVYSQDEEGIYDLISLMEKVRLALLEDYEINPKFLLIFQNKQVTNLLGNLLPLFHLEYLLSYLILLPMSDTKLQKPY